MSRRTFKPTEEEELYIYSQEDIERILGDAFVDLREISDDETAAQSIDIMYERLIDDFYDHTR